MGESLKAGGENCLAFSNIWGFMGLDVYLE